MTRGADPGAAGAPLAEILGGAWGEYAADLQRDGLPGWEAERVASVMLAGGLETTGRQGVASSARAAGMETRCALEKRWRAFCRGVPGS